MLGITSLASGILRVRILLYYYGICGEGFPRRLRLLHGAAGWPWLCLELPVACARASSRRLLRRVRGAVIVMLDLLFTWHWRFHGATGKRRRYVTAVVVEIFWTTSSSLSS